MIACVYGSAASAFVEATVRDLARTAAADDVELIGVPIGRIAQPGARVMDDVALVYVLPFDEDVDPAEAFPLVFPKAHTVNAPAAHELSTDRVLLSERLLERGVPVPETLVTASPEEARDFILRHEHAVLRDPRIRGHSSGYVVFCDDAGTVVGETRDRRYVIELLDSGLGRKLEHGVLAHPPPFFLQRMVTRVGRRGILIPAQVLRAYVIDDQVPFWTEAYRDRIKRPADFLLTSESGAPRRFVQVVSSEADKLARRAAKAVGAPIAAVDIIRADTGYVVLDVVTDGRYVMIDRSFKNIPEFREAFDLDRHIATALIERLGERN
jgi:hypothetical protein